MRKTIGYQSQRDNKRLICRFIKEVVSKFDLQIVSNYKLKHFVKVLKKKKLTENAPI